MRYLNADEQLQMSGVGYAGDVHEGPDGNLYEWVEGVDAWGGEIGYWQGLSLVQDAGFDGLGALYQASDGSMYQVAGFGAEEADEPEVAAAPAEEDTDAAPPPRMGPGRPGEIRVGPDGKRYRWVLGVGAGGERKGFWRRLRARARFRRPPARPRPRPGMQARRPPAGAGRRPPTGGAPGRKRKPFLRRILPFAKAATALIPGVGPAVAAGLTVATPLLKKAGIAGPGLGALYEAPDGSLYAIHGFAEGDLEGPYEYDGMNGFIADDELDGFADVEQIEGVADDDVAGFAEDDYGPGVVGVEDLDGYVRDDRDESSLRAYVTEPLRKTPMARPSPEADIWKPNW
ncbi:MAG: hypothetical protein ACRD1U_11855 [Vicinamibacterales bacterium]